MSLNKAMIIGNAGKDPEVRYIDSRSGKVKAATFTVATDERFRDSSGAWKEHTEWHSVIVWNRLADFVEKYVKKGTQLYIEGRIRTRSWDDQNGVKRYTTEIYADNMQMLSRADGDTGTRSSGTYTPPVPPVPPAQPANPMPMDDPDDLPF